MINKHIGDAAMKMRRKKLLGAGLILLILCLLGFQTQSPAEWQRPTQPSLAGNALTCLAAHPLDASKFLVASKQQVFEGGDEPGWKSLWCQSDGNAPIQRIFSFSVLPDVVFAVTTRHVFMGNLKDRSWRMIYKDSEKTPLAFALDPKNPNHWLLGTRRGLLETKTAGQTWSLSPILRTSKPVPLVVFEHDRLFIASENTLHLALSENTARPILDLSQSGTDLAEQEIDDPLSLEDPLSYDLKIHDLIASKRNTQELFLATKKGVFRSLDGGHRWEPLSRSGLQSISVQQLAYASKTDRLYAATPRGIYAYEASAQRWSALFEGLARNEALSIAVVNEAKLIAITKDGFVQYPLEGLTPEGGTTLRLYQPSEETLSLFKELISLEPSAREIHQHVIRYADVTNSKIKRWHALSRIAGLLPSFSFGKSMNRNDSVTTYSGKYITGPEDVSKSWDADVSWDLGDMVYSSDQTSIDSREKMMVELRNDLLSEATRIYYERRRLQIDLVFTSPASEQEHLENLLRLDELSSLLDGMTDGFFSQQLEQIYERKPGFNTLWAYQTKNGFGDSGLAPRDSNQNLE